MSFKEQPEKKKIQWDLEKSQLVHLDMKKKIEIKTQQVNKKGYPEKSLIPGLEQGKQKMNL